MTMTRRFALLGPATVALGAAAFSSTPARAAMKTESIDYSHGDTKLKAYVAYDDTITGRRPAIFMVHAREGLTDFAKRQAVAQQEASMRVAWDALHRQGSHFSRDGDRLLIEVGQRLRGIVRGRESGALHAAFAHDMQAEEVG